MTTKKKLLFFIPSLLLFVSAFLPESRKTIFPTKDGNIFRVVPYVDYIDTTKGSMGNVTLSDSVLLFEYTLKTVNNNDVIKPISGFSLWFDVQSNGRFLDVSKYDYLDITVSMMEASSFILYLKTYEHFTDTTNWVTQRYTEKEITLEPRVSEYRLLFKEFSTPQWWKSLIGAKFLTLPPKPDYKKVTSIDFQNNPGGHLNVPERIEIRKVEFRKNRRFFYCTTIGGGFLWIIIIVLVLYIIKKKKRGSRDEIGKHIKPVPLIRQSEEQLLRLTTFITSNFQLSELSIKTVSKETAIGESKISALLQQKYRMNFKKYLNHVRILESKRLLKNTDRTIAEIAFAVGYNSIPHFNRVFRENVNLTPTEFRESNHNK